MTALVDMTDDDLAAAMADVSRSVDDRITFASALGDRRARARDAAHAAFHGHPLKYGRVGRRRGYLGDTVCLDCYYGKEWNGR
jgi:hypothetical protein